MRKILILISGIAVFSLLVGFVSPTSKLYAQTSNEQSLCEGSGGVYSNGSCSKPGDNKSVGDFIKNAVNVLMFIVGAVSVVMLIFGGFRYATSNGDQALIKQAKDTILYSIVGLIVAISSYAIVDFVFSNI